MTQNFDADFLAFAAWYRDHARPLVEKLDQAKGQEWDAEWKGLDTAARSMEQETAVCFLGNAGVGKSTLINALMRETLLPAGGIGPLTAQALVVRKGDPPSFRAQYHSSKSLWQLWWGLRFGYKAELRQTPNGLDDELREVLPSEELLSFQDDWDDWATVGQSTLSRREELRKQAQLLVTGRQDGAEEVAYLLDSLHESLERPRVFGTTARSEDAERVLRLREVLALVRDDRAYTLERSSDDRMFRSRLGEHAAGFLAPLIQKLEVCWNTPLLEGGLALVDLPGIGIAGDVYRKVTGDWIREKARAIVLVVDSRGISEANADLLRSSGFLNRLLYASNDPSDDAVALLIAVVRIDDVAAERRLGDKNKTKRAHFAEIQNESARLVRGQLGEQLAAVWRQGDEPLSENQQEVIANVVKSVQVHPVSAVEHRKYRQDDEDEPPFIVDEVQSGIPGLAENLRDLAAHRREVRRVELRRKQKGFMERVVTTLRAAQPATEEISRATEEARRLRDGFRDFLTKKQKEYHVRLGAFSEFWKSGLPQQIEQQVTLASQTAGRRINGYLSTLKDVHYRTLQAAVRQGGAFVGARRIDLPNDLTLCFDGAVAEVWGKPILQDIRARTKQFADDGAALVQEAVYWAREHDCPQLAKQLLVQLDASLADAKQLESVGRDRATELREAVKDRLVQTIEGPIRLQCRRFVAGGQNQGSGIRARILELFQELAGEVTATASKQAIELLTQCVRDTKEAIDAVQSLQRDPLQAAQKLAETALPASSPELQSRLQLGREVEKVLARLPSVSVSERPPTVEVLA